jgi:hypothetical protein
MSCDDSNKGEEVHSFLECQRFHSQTGRSTTSSTWEKDRRSSQRYPEKNTLGQAEMAIDETINVGQAVASTDARLFWGGGVAGARKRNFKLGRNATQIFGIECVEKMVMGRAEGEVRLCVMEQTLG